VVGVVLLGLVVLEVAAVLVVLEPRQVCLLHRVLHTQLQSVLVASVVLLHLHLLRREEILYLTVSPQLAAVLDKAIQIMQMVVLVAGHLVVPLVLRELELVDKATTAARVGL
jgi:hypothetical protein